jgi:hypothetical protein
MFTADDLLVTTTQLAIRLDGFTFDESDLDEDKKVPTSWLSELDILPQGAICLYIKPDPENENRTIVRRAPIGRVMSIRSEFLKKY